MMTMRREAWSAIIGGMVGAAFVLLVGTTVPALQAQQSTPAPAGTNKMIEELAGRQQEILDGQEALAKDVRAMMADVKEIRQSVGFLKKRSRNF